MAESPEMKMPFSLPEKPGMLLNFVFLTSYYIQTEIKRRPGHFRAASADYAFSCFWVLSGFFFILHPARFPYITKKE